MLGGVAAMSAGSVAPANLVLNGDFEKPVVAVGRYVLFAPGQSFPGWKVVGEPGNVAPISGKYTSTGLAFPSHGGKQWLDMTGLSNTATGVEQAVATLAGARYDLSFCIGNVVDPRRAFGVSSAVEVFVDGKSLGVMQNSEGAGKLSLVWKKFHRTVTAAGPSTVIRFINRDPRTDYSNGLDDVAMVAVRP
jgi:hypothetical protein